MVGALICRSAKTRQKADGYKLPTKVRSSKFGKSVACIITMEAQLPDLNSGNDFDGSLMRPLHATAQINGRVNEF